MQPATSRKVTYSLPSHLVDEVDRRARKKTRSKSTVVAEALERYFADQDRKSLARIYAEASRDPLFRADNEAVMRDFAALDEEAAREIDSTHGDSARGDGQG